MESGRDDGRYQILFKLAAGGMATVYVGTARGSMGFRQLVAIKEPHAQWLDDPAYRKELLTEARLAALIHHVNVVDVRDVYVTNDDVHGNQVRLVMDYVEGASLGELLVAASRVEERLTPAAVIRIALDASAGLHAAHELVDEKRRPVGLVHRDVSPQNILVGTDGAARVTDFGVAKATAMAKTASGSLKGKLAYMAPEYLEGGEIDRRSDVFALGVVVWEALAGKRLFRGENEVDTAQRILSREAPPISSVVPELGALDEALASALAKSRKHRFATARAFAAALEASAQPLGLVGSQTDVGALVARLAGPRLEARRAQIQAKLAHEPGFLSLMRDEPIGIASPEGATTVPDATPPAAIALGYGSAEPTTSEAPAPAGVRRSRSVLPALVAAVALLGGAAIFLLAHSHTHEPARAHAPDESAAPASAKLADPASAPASVAAIAPLVVAASAPTPSNSAPSQPHAARRARVPVASTASPSDPPPNPY